MTRLKAVGSQAQETQSSTAETQEENRTTSKQSANNTNRVDRSNARKAEAWHYGVLKHSSASHLHQSPMVSCQPHSVSSSHFLSSAAVEDHTLTLKRSSYLSRRHVYNPATVLKSQTPSEGLASRSSCVFRWVCSSLGLLRKWLIGSEGHECFTLTSSNKPRLFPHVWADNVLSGFSKTKPECSIETRNTEKNRKEPSVLTFLSAPAQASV